MSPTPNNTPFNPFPWIEETFETQRMLPEEMLTPDRLERAYSGVSIHALIQLHVALSFLEACKRNAFQPLIDEVRQHLSRYPETAYGECLDVSRAWVLASRHQRLDREGFSALPVARLWNTAAPDIHRASIEVLEQVLSLYRSDQYFEPLGNDITPLIQEMRNRLT